MGNSQIKGLSREILDDLKVNTKFTEAEIMQSYENFQKQCPSGLISQDQFVEIYIRCFPDSDAKSYAQHVFRSFDTNNDGTLDFKEYIVALHMTSSAKTALKLEWAFSLFDVDKNGYITKTEVCELCRAIFKLIPKDKLEDLPNDENTAEKRAEKLWTIFGKKDNEQRNLSRFGTTQERLAEGEFIEGVSSSQVALRLIQYDSK